MRAIASEALPETTKITMGKDGGLIEILYAAAGFLLVRREVYETVRQPARLVNVALYAPPPPPVVLRGP